MSNSADFSASQLLSLYSDRQLSPVAVTKAALERINTYKLAGKRKANVALALRYKQLVRFQLCGYNSTNSIPFGISAAN